MAVAADRRNSKDARFGEHQSLTGDSHLSAPEQVMESMVVGCDSVTSERPSDLLHHEEALEMLENLGTMVIQSFDAEPSREPHHPRVHLPEGALSTVNRW